MTAPLTLAEVREIAEAKRNGYWKSRDIGPLCATIEWLAERIKNALAICETCPYGPGDCTELACESSEEALKRWLRGES